MYSIKKQWFSIAIISCIVVAYLFTQSGLILEDQISAYIKFSLIILIFLLSGMTIGTDKLHQSLRQWPIHCFIQTVSFVLFPMMVFVIAHLFLPFALSTPTYVGFIVLACIPTTITSCVVFTSAAGGNAESALFNATLGNIIGIIITPFLIYLLVSKNIHLDPVQAIKKLFALVILPFFIGQIVRSQFNLNFNTSQIRSANNVMVLGIIVLAFIKTFQQGIVVELQLLNYIVLLSLVLKIFVTAFCWYLSGLFESTFSQADRICITLTATPKTLAMGLPLIAILFADNPNFALISLPMICYYTIQLLIDSFLVDRLAQIQSSNSKYN